jgi:hypothetical protein
MLRATHQRGALKLPGVTCKHHVARRCEALRHVQGSVQYASNLSPSVGKLTRHQHAFRLTAGVDTSQLLVSQPHAASLPGTCGYSHFNLWPLILEQYI